MMMAVWTPGSYLVRERAMTVRNNWVESAFAMLNGAPTFITLPRGASGSPKGSRTITGRWRCTARDC